MSIEESLAAKKLSKLIKAGYSKESAINQTVKFLVTQNFSKDYSKQIATKIVELV